ncbi:MAG: DUF3800 domain-containing protein [Dermatophilaceae bacterium]
MAALPDPSHQGTAHHPLRPWPWTPSHQTPTPVHRRRRRTPQRLRPGRGTHLAGSAVLDRRPRSRSRVPARRTHRLAEVKAGCYAALVDQWERRLTERDELAMLFMDGDGSDRRFIDVHRRLPLQQRRVIEGVVHIDSAQSQLVQMADLVAWTAWTTIDRPANNKFAWDWYDTYLARLDPARAPRSI